MRPMRHDKAPEDDYDGPSRSQRKRDAAAVQALGVELIAMTPAELDELPLSETLRDAIDLAKRITAHGALVRQQQYIGKLMRKLDPEPIRAALAARELAQKTAAREFHRLEAWRDRLIAEGEPAIASLLASAPALDGAQLRRLVSEAQAEHAAGRPPAASRALFRLLRDSLAAAPPVAQ